MNCVGVMSGTVPALDQFLPTEQGAEGGEKRSIRQQPAHHGRGLGGQIDRFADDGETEPAVGGGQQEAAKLPMAAASVGVAGRRRCCRGPPGSSWRGKNDTRQLEDLPAGRRCTYGHRKRDGAASPPPNSTQNQVGAGDRWGEPA